VPRNLLLFFGAGASKPLGVPTNREFYDEFLKAYDAGIPDLGNFPHIFYDDLRTRLGTYGVEPVDLEAIMTILTALADEDPRMALLEAGKPAAAFAVSTQLAHDFYGTGTQRKAEGLLRAIRRFIRIRCQGLDISKLASNYDPIFDSFVGENAIWNTRRGNQRIEPVWNTRGDKQFPKAWCFTTNYDRALEEYFEDVSLPCYQGWTVGPGERKLDPLQIHRGGEEMSIFKLHGSVDFIRLPGGSVGQSLMLDDAGTTVGGRKISEQVLIFPTQEKELFRFPFIDFFEEFVRALRETPLWAFFGFSFTDEPIRRLITTEATRDKKLMVVSPDATGLCKKALPDLAKMGCLFPIDTKVGDPNFKERFVGTRTSA
jgi:hypothetical protein